MSAMFEQMQQRLVVLMVRLFVSVVPISPPRNNSAVVAVAVVAVVVVAVVVIGCGVRHFLMHE